MLHSCQLCLLTLSLLGLTKMAHGCKKEIITIHNNLCKNITKKKRETRRIALRKIFEIVTSEALPFKLPHLPDALYASSMRLFFDCNERDLQKKRRKKGENN